MMSKKSLIVILSVLTAGSLGFLYFRQQNAVLEVSTVTISHGGLTKSISASGELRALDRVELKFSGGGEIAALNVGAGDKVVKGQVLAALDQRALRETLFQAEMGLRKVRADLDYACETRRKFLEDHKYDSPSEDIFAQFGQQDAKVRAAAVLVESYNSQVESAKIALDNTTLKSPISGAVIEINGKVGEIVSPVSVKPLFVIADFSFFVFEAEVDETEIGQVEIGQKAKITLDAYLDQEFVGKVSWIDSLAHITSSGGTAFAVKIELRPSETSFKIGMNGEAKIILSEKQNVLFVPLEAILEKEGQRFVFVVEDSAAKLRKIETGLANDTAAEIVSGLSGGEKVVTGDLDKLKDGQEIHVTAN